MRAHTMRVVRTRVYAIRANRELVQSSVDLERKVGSQKLKYFETDIILVLIFFGKRSIICITKIME